MTCTVLLFAKARDLFGGRSVVLELSTPTVASVRTALAQHTPTAHDFLTRCAIAVNNDYADDTRELSPTDEIALIPPVSGGQL